MAETTATEAEVLETDDRPDTPRAWLRSLWRYRQVLIMLARADFHVRYKRASFGVAWAVVVPLVQASVLAIFFSRVIRVSDGGVDFTAYVLSGVLPWSYFAQTALVGSTALVDGAGLADKVWFPRAMMPMVPALANVVGLFISLAFLIVLLPLLHSSIGPRILLLVPAVVLLLGFTMALTMALSALHVYFRDVRFLLQAAMLIWFYVTPIAYPAGLVGSLRGVVDLNPMTGIVTLFHMATVGAQDGWQRPVVASTVITVVLLLVGAEAQRRHDRLFVDLL